MSERLIDCDGSHIWTTVTGDRKEGTPVILINGGPGCDDYLEDVAALIEDRCRVVRFEPRGCGRSSWDGHYDLDTMVSDIELVRQDYEFERVILVGHSFGPDVGLAYTLAHRRNALGLVGIAGGRIVDDRQWHATYKQNQTERGEEYPKEFHADPRVNPIGNASWKAYIKRPSLLSDVAALNIPATYIAGGRDIRPNWPIKQLAGLLRADYIEIEDAEHCIWMTHPDELRGALSDAIDKIAGG